MATQLLAELGGLVMRTLSTEQPVNWSPSMSVPIQHVNLTETETLASVMRGIAQAARREGKEINANKLPTDDDD